MMFLLPTARCSQLPGSSPRIAWIALLPRSSYERATSNTRPRIESTFQQWRLLRLLPMILAAVCLLAPTAHPMNADDEPQVLRDAFLHLDADSQPTLRQERNLEPLKPGEMVDRWIDRSNHRHDFFAKGDHGPRWQAFTNASSFRFDGIDDAMRLSTSIPSLAKCSIWLVVAPHANPGDFRGLLATNSPQQRDYESGLNIDLGPGPSRTWDTLNVEGHGFSGAKNVLQSPHPFGTLHILEVRIDSEAREVSLRVDGTSQLQRPMTASSFSIEEWTLGARYYTNGPGEQQIRGHSACDIAELIVFDRLLSAEETVKLEEHLTAKHRSLAEQIPAALARQTESYRRIQIENPPVLQMLQPGFDVYRLPVELTNVNNVLYRHDGRLVTLGYNGDIHLLRDSDGDGIEDTATVFYKNQGSLRGPIGMQWTPSHDPRGQGAFVASKGKISFLKDTDGDDQADEEIVIAKGWEEIPQNVDAVGLALGPDGSIYFGLGTANYANAYLVDDAGASQYDLHSDRGTIQRIAPDFSSRQAICTGVRFPIGIAFNAEGDLFCTDQEGATWLPNGNPFDELLHIRPSLHYGFPPRHPRHNPNVIDEPSVFDYGPQHQSTCGLIFNRSTDALNRFGPATWGDNALVCGESRGKLWRTKLVSTPAGYVAQSQLIGALQMLTIDSCLSPAGELVVACHSGPPDWGTGPAGIGTLFKIRTQPGPIPRPISAWSASASEFRIAFDHPLDPTHWRDLATRIHIEAGPFARAGDRYESLIPPYAVVQSQALAPRRSVPVVSVGVTPDMRTLILNVPPQSSADHYAISLPSPATLSSDGATTSAATNPSTSASQRFLIEQLPEMDIDATLHGVLATWTPDDPSQPTWQGTLPHADLSVSKPLTANSATHDTLWQSLSSAGTLTLSTTMDLRDILRPKVQPGSQLDYQLPEERVTLLWNASENADVIESTSMSNIKGTRLVVEVPDPLANGKTPPSDEKQKGFIVEFPTSRDANDGLHPLTLTIKKRQGDILQSPSLFAVHTNEDANPRALPLHRFRLPWMSSTETKDSQLELAKAPELDGGNWGRGRRLFHSPEVGCSKCHAAPGSGQSLGFGPDLSNLVFRDYTSVLRDINQPSYAINPEFIGHQVRLVDGTVLTGVLRDLDGKLLLGDATGKSMEIERAAIDTMKPSVTSVMPSGLLEKMSTTDVRDLMTYLLLPAPRMPIEGPVLAPKTRTAAEVAAVLAGSAPASRPLKEIKIVLVAGPKDHGPGEHDYPAWLTQWGQLLTAAESVSLEVSWEFPSPEQMASADLLVFFQKGSWNAERATAMDAFQHRGGGAIYLHWAVNGNDQVAAFSERIGLASWGGKIKYRHGPLELKTEDTSHPIMRNINALDLLDESYWLLTGDIDKIHCLASSIEDGEPRPQCWTYERNGGRVFVSIPGHYNWTFDDPIFRTMVLRAMAWTVREPIDRFNDLVPLGARMEK